MLFTWFIISVFLMLLGILVYKEYKKEKAYQEERDRHCHKDEKPEPVSTKAPLTEDKPESLETSGKSKATQEIPDTILQKDTDNLQVKEKGELPVKASETPKEVIELPTANYPEFDHSRLVEMGLSQEEAKEFIQELIVQIKTQIPLIKEALYDLDFHNMERLTHSIKGSATNIGTGGISDLLVDYNTYLKTGTEITVAQRYFMYLQYQLKMLEKQYTV